MSAPGKVEQVNIAEPHDDVAVLVAKLFGQQSLDLWDKGATQLPRPFSAPAFLGRSGHPGFSLLVGAG